MKKRNFLCCSAVLIISAILSKLIGAMFKIPLTDFIGGVGMGYFSGAYGLFLPIYAVFVTGLSAASAKLTAEMLILYGSRGASAVKKNSLISFGCIGIVGTLLIVVAAKPFAKHIIGNDDVYISLLIIAPSVLFSCITAAYRGCCEGRRNMYPTAISQLTEGVVKLAGGLLMCRYVLHNEEYFAELLGEYCTDRYALAAAGAVAGVTLSSFAGMLYMIVSDIISKPSCDEKGYLDAKKMKSSRYFIRSLIKILIPVSISALITNLTSLVDLVTIIRYVDSAVEKNTDYFMARYPFINEMGTENFAAFVYGSFNGLAVTVFNLVPSVTNMFGKSILPAVTDAWTKKDMLSLTKNTEAVLKITSLISVPAGLGICVLSKEILLFLFPSSVNEVALAAGSLAFLGPPVIMLSVSFPVFSMLQAVGREDLPAKIMVIGVIVKLAGNMLLIRIPQLNAAGAALSTGLCYTVILGFSVCAFFRYTKVRINIRNIFIRPVYAGVMCMTAAVLCRNITRDIFSTGIVLALSVFAGAAVYITVIYLMGETKWLVSELRT